MKVKSAEALFSSNHKNPFHPDILAHTLEKQEAYFLARAEFKEAVNPIINTHIIEMSTDKPVRILGFSDLHFASDATDHKNIDILMEDVLNDPNTIVVLLGDELEGIKDEYLRTNVTKTALDFDEQIRVFKAKYMSRLARANKIIGIVSVYEGHNEWANTKSTVNVIRDLAEEFNVPLIINGGHIEIRYQDGNKLTMQIFHNPGSGNTRIDPVGALRKKSMERKLGPGFPDVLASGHIHLMAIAQETIYDPIGKSAKAVTMTSLGTEKGTTEKNPDHFFVANARSLPQKSGVFFVTHKENGQQNIRPIIGADNSKFVRNAYSLLEDLERNNAVPEIIDQISRKHTHQKPRYDFKHAARSRNELNRDYAHGMYEVLPTRLGTDLPIALYPLAHMRFGSGSINTDVLDKLIQHTVCRPNVYALSLGEIIDYELANRSDRVEQLTTTASSLRRLDDCNKHLGFMFMGGLRHDAWGKDKTKSGGSEPLIPSEILRTSGIRAPYILHNSIMPLGVGKTEYLLHFLYHLNHSGNAKSPFVGLGKAADETRLPIDITMGGHMPNSGYLQTHDRVLVAPGWLSTYRAQNKANAREVPPGGQSVILFPNKKTVIPSATLEDSIATFNAVYIAYASDIDEKINNVTGKMARNKTSSARTRL